MEEPEWNRYPDTKPPSDCVCYVTNEKSGIWCYQAIYFAKADYFRYAQRDMGEVIPLEVTHWFKLPEPLVYG